MQVTRDYLKSAFMSEEQRQKELEYLDYVEEHIANVQKAWNIMKNKPECMDYIKSLAKTNSFYVYLQLVKLIDRNIRHHDESKLEMEEWEPYRQYFYPINEKEKENAKESFEFALQHHYQYNLHHWNWWDKNDCKGSMSVVYVIEMCCDWIAMGLKYNNSAYDWYKKQTDIKLGKFQQSVVETLLKLFYGIKES